MTEANPTGRPARLVVVTGTGTGVGKTWVAAQLLASLREARTTVSARKPVQSLDPADLRSDADLLAIATGEPPDAVCLPHRTYRLAIAPPMAAEALGLPPFTVADLAAEIAWPGGTEVGVVEGAGGTCSPLAADGDTRDLIAALAPDCIVLVARPDLGAIHDVRAAVASLTEKLGAEFGGARLLVHLNLFSPQEPLHGANASWLAVRCGLEVVTTVSAAYFVSG